MALDFGFTVEHCDTGSGHDWIVYSLTSVFGKAEYCRCDSKSKADVTKDALILFSKASDEQRKEILNGSS